MASKKVKKVKPAKAALDTAATESIVAVNGNKPAQNGPVKKKKKNDPLRPQPAWLFPPDEENPILNPKNKSKEQIQKEINDRLAAIKFLEHKSVTAPVKTAPPSELLQLIGAFFASYGFVSTGRIFSLERNARKKLDGWNDEIGEKKFPKNMPDLVNIFKDWRADFEGDSDAETSSDEEEDEQTSAASSDSDSSSDDSSDSEEDVKKSAPQVNGVKIRTKLTGKESVKPIARKETKKSNSENSDSHSESDGDADKAPEMTKATKTDDDSDSDSDSASSSESESESESEKPSSKKLSNGSTTSIDAGKATTKSNHGFSSTIREASPEDASSSSSSSSETDESSDDRAGSEDAMEITSTPSTSEAKKRKAASQAPEGTEEDANDNHAQPYKKTKTQNEPFSRIPKDTKVDPRFASNDYVSYDYADRAHRDLIVTKGKGFTKEKNKKKRGSYRGGKIDTSGGKGVKFDD